MSAAACRWPVVRVVPGGDVRRQGTATSAVVMRFPRFASLETWLSGFVWDRSRVRPLPDTPCLLVLVGRQAVEPLLESAGGDTNRQCSAKIAGSASGRVAKALPGQQISSVLVAGDRFSAASSNESPTRSPSTLMTPRTTLPGPGP